MLYRRLDPNGDYVMGRGEGGFWRDVPDAVAQAVTTRLGLETGQWFLNLNEGIAWHGDVLGERTTATRDPAIRARILGTAGLRALATYDSQVDRDTRAFSVQATIDTVYGAAALTAAVAGNP